MLALAICVLAGAGNAATTVIGDGEFSPLDWSNEVVVTVGTGTAFVTREPSGGDPGAYQRNSLLPDSFSEVRVLNFYRGKRYFPRLGGAITRLETRFDKRLTEGQPSPLLLVALEQDGIPFVRSGVTTSGETNWHPAGPIANTFFSQFSALGQPGLFPDFSEQGSPIAFGYVFQGQCSGPQPACEAIELDVDDWSVTVESIEPAVELPVLGPEAVASLAGAMAIAGLLALGGRASSPSRLSPRPR